LTIDHSPLTKNKTPVFQFITKRPLWINMLFAIVLVFLLLLLLLFSLDWMTHHGTVLKIPQVTGKTMEEAKKQLEDQGFDVLIQDSLYVDTMAPLKVIKQFPEADELVKVSRTVYLTVNRAQPPKVDMPNLVGLSFRSAALVLKQYGLKLGDTSSRPDFAKNAVLSQLYDGKEIQPGTKIVMASSISLILGAGIADEDMAVPDLVGMSYGDAKVLMEGSGLSFGSIVTNNDVKDSASAYIYFQSPAHWSEDRRVNRIHQGQMIDIKIQVEKPVIDSSAIKAPATKPNDY
jgi:beta-lactam-binding protein with PASTA domain